MYCVVKRFFQGRVLATDEAEVLVGLYDNLTDSWDFREDFIQLITFYVTENKVLGQFNRENPFINQSCRKAIRAMNTKRQNTNTVSATLNMIITSYCSYARPAQPGSIR